MAKPLPSFITLTRSPYSAPRGTNLEGTVYLNTEYIIAFFGVTLSAGSEKILAGRVAIAGSPETIYDVQETPDEILEKLDLMEGP